MGFRRRPWRSQIGNARCSGNIPTLVSIRRHDHARGEDLNWRSAMSPRFKLSFGDLDL